MKASLRLAQAALLLFTGITLTRHEAHAQLGGFHCPLKVKAQIRQGDSLAKEGGRFNSSRGPGRTHGGLDLNSPEGTEVFASLAGRAAVAQTDWGAMGNTVIVDHGAGAYTVYGHLKTVSIKENETVKTGQRIGTVGFTGNASALRAAKLPAHLHFALVQAGQTGLADNSGPLRKMKEWGDSGKAWAPASWAPSIPLSSAWPTAGAGARLSAPLAKSN